MNKITRPAAHKLFHVKTVKKYAGTQTAEDVAFHEAGHAVLRRLTGLPLTTIAIQQTADEAIVGFVGNVEPDEGLHAVSTGDTTLMRARPLLDVAEEYRKPLAIRRCCVALAGLQSELLLRDVDLAGPVIRDDEDHRCALAVLRDGFGFNSDHLFFPQLLTRFYLARCWLAVSQTARALLAEYGEGGVGILQRSTQGQARHFQTPLDVRWRDDDWR